MATIPGTNVVAPVVPLDTTDTHPSHEALYGRGGYRSVTGTADRDAIPAARREVGMLVYVAASGGSLWQLGSDLTTWTEFAAGGGGEPPVVDSHRKLAQQQPVDFKGGVQFPHPVEEQIDRVGAVDRKRANLARPDLPEIARDDLEEPRGRFGEQGIERRGRHPQPEVSGVFKNFVHGDWPPRGCGGEKQNGRSIRLLGCCGRCCT